MPSYEVAIIMRKMAHHHYKHHNHHPRHHHHLHHHCHPHHQVAFIMRKMAHPATVQALKRAAGEVYTSGGYIRSSFIKCSQFQNRSGLSTWLLIRFSWGRKKTEKTWFFQTSDLKMCGVGGLSFQRKFFVNSITFDNTHLFRIEIRLSKFDLFQIATLNKEKQTICEPS